MYFILKQITVYKMVESDFEGSIAHNFYFKWVAEHACTLSML